MRIAWELYTRRSVHGRASGGAQGEGPGAAAKLALDGLHHVDELLLGVNPQLGVDVLRVVASLTCIYRNG